ncbi:MazE family transcriptional regulator [Balneola sp. EhC07]|jgi:antitoxin component of MazEF toxin-antitoxin module|uniref:AbrB/MazE/SpoVT family DNA-binding domain-containing protein n=1 Tax=Balneola sp. EhC07 TaxID=1849360 RepID=UPI0007F3E646|nr:MazE family transcriptional regulator [Balneola sp. EhC07]MBR9917427.1 MazE family transcriptional regulator [bacterium]OAN61238.1 MazE family transcriptional regulator [Balneola sp. EhC07]|tara:strand:+ start:57378 stop:57584 length:207 start_codon:yes stop_codon:yes gene_type:complete
MIKKLQNIGNSRGIILEKSLLKLLRVEQDDQVEIVPQEDGLLIKKIDVKSAYKRISEKHRRSLDKLGE